MSRAITEDEVRRLTGREVSSPYTPVHEGGFMPGQIDYDDIASWYYPGSEQIRPQTRVYKIIGANGKPTGQICYAKNEVQAAALRQRVEDKSGHAYIPSAELVDIIYDDEQ